jgi:hypothetical protein
MAVKAITLYVFSLFPFIQTILGQLAQIGINIENNRKIIENSGK